MNHTKANFLSLLPFLIFVGTFLGAGIVLQDFYALPSPIAVSIGIIAAFAMSRLPHQEKIKTFLHGCGESSVLTMCIIYLLAGAFSTVAQVSGSVDAVVNIGLTYISADYYALGIFLLASFLSLSSGTSVGAIVALGPIAIQLAQKSGADLNLIGASLLGGAMFGDNLSVISDTTIAAAQTLGSSMKDKFRTNFYLAAPAVVLTVVILLIIGFSNPVAPIAYTPTPISWELIFPYLVVLVLAFLGLDVFLVLVIGIFLAGAIGLWQGNLTWLSFAKSSYEGFTSMTEIFLLSLLTGGLAALVEKAGGIQYLLNKIEAKISSAKSAQLGAGLITGLVNLCIANNTVSILISGKVLRPISERFEVPARKMASVIDIFACIVQGLLPYGAQVLLIIGYSKNKINYVDMLSHSYYLGLLFLMVVGSMFWGRSRNLVPSIGSGIC